MQSVQKFCFLIIKYANFSRPFRPCCYGYFFSIFSLWSCTGPYSQLLTKISDNSVNSAKFKINIWVYSIFVKTIKWPKPCQKRLYKHIIDLLCKKRLQKTLNIREFKRFWKLEKWSLCKMVNLGQKMKLPKTCQKRLYERITDVLCKKRL